jgi:hypothetical protein
MKRIIVFIFKGFNVFSDSSKGAYSERTDEVRKLRHDILNDDFGSFKTDKENLMKDRYSVSKDIKNAFHNLVVSNG